MKRLIPILGLLCCLARPASATLTMTQHLSNIACGGVASCVVSGFTAIAAGSMIVGIGYKDSGITITATAGASGGGTWVVPSACTGTAACSQVDGTARSVDMQYILSSTGTPTTITCTASTTDLGECEVIVYTFTGSSVAFDVGATVARTANANLAGLSPGTLTGTNDVILQYGVFSTTATACPNTAASPGDFPNGNAACGLINTTSTTAGNYTNVSGTAAIASVAFKEIGGAVAVPKRSLMGVGT